MITILLTALSLQDLTDESYEKLRDSIRPTAEELAWNGIDWLPTFWQAVQVAQKEEKPILLWAMNGHPLACT
jgi:hypothetical protein